MRYTLRVEIDSQEDAYWEQFCCVIKNNFDIRHFRYSGGFVSQWLQMVHIQRETQCEFNGWTDTNYIKDG